MLVLWYACAGFAQQDKLIGQIKIKGNQKTKREAILAEIMYKSGDRYTEDLPAEIQRRVMNLGYFEYVKVTTSPATDTNLVDIQIEVKERITYGLYPIVDLREGDDIYGAEIAENNLLGLGKSISASYLWSNGSNSLSVDFYDRHLFWSNFILGTGAGVSEATTRWYDTAGNFLSETDRDTTSAYIQAGYWFSYTTRGFLTLSVRDDDYSIRTGTYSPPEGRTDKFSISLIYSDTRYGIYTLEGPVFWGQFQKGHKWFDGDFDFEKVSLGGTYYWNVTEDHILIISVGAGRGWNLPVHERFSIGGSGTLRGYDPGTYQGNRYGLARAEYRLPVAKPTLGKYSGTLSMVGFVDLGYAWQEDQSVDLSDLETGTGCGLRFYFNQFQRGVIAADIAYGFEPQDVKFYLSFGATF
jgi:outer membrane protein insertion porin family